MDNRRFPKLTRKRKDQDEDKLCKSIIKGLARRNREKHAILAETPFALPGGAQIAKFGKAGKRDNSKNIASWKIREYQN